MVAAIRSPAGASAALLRAARAARVRLLATAPLCFEYESVCHRLEHALAPGLDTMSVDVFVDAVVDLVEPVEIWFMWRPQLRDPGDELMLEAAVSMVARPQSPLSIASASSPQPNASALKSSPAAGLDQGRGPEACGTGWDQPQPVRCHRGGREVGSLRTASYFAERKGRADWEAFDRLMARPNRIQAATSPTAPGIIAATGTEEARCWTWKNPPT
jgi:PIN domain-containing protein